MQRHPADSVIRSVPQAAISKLTSKNVSYPFSYRRDSSLQRPSTFRMASKLVAFSIVEFSASLGDRICFLIPKNLLQF